LSFIYVLFIEFVTIFHIYNLEFSPDRSPIFLRLLAELPFAYICGSIHHGGSRRALGESLRWYCEIPPLQLGTGLRRFVLVSRGFLPYLVSGR